MDKPFMARLPRAETGDALIAKMNKAKQPIVHSLRALIQKTLPDVVESIKYLIPYYELAGPLCYINPGPKAVELGFSRGREIAHLDESGLFTGTGNTVRKIRFENEIDLTQMQELEHLLSLAAAWNLERNLVRKKANNSVVKTKQKILPTKWECVIIRV